jgi:uncharacterized protein YdeI (YjbR/CyaY-like superfamily)
MSSAAYFRSAADFRRWLETNHATSTELLVGFYKKGSGNGGLTYPEALDELLCFGWIDGLKRRVDAERFTQRVTPRRRGSIWSLVNVRHVERLTRAGRMHPAGITAFAARRADKTGIYSFENRPQVLPAHFAKIFRANPKAWTFFMAQPPGYRRLVIFKIVSAKQEATRRRWLARAIIESAQARRLGEFGVSGKRRP